MSCLFFFLYVVLRGADGVKQSLILNLVNILRYHVLKAPIPFIYTIRSLIYRMTAIISPQSVQKRGRRGEKRDLHNTGPPVIPCSGSPLGVSEARDSKDQSVQSSTISDSLFLFSEYVSRLVTSSTPRTKKRKARFSLPGFIYSIFIFTSEILQGPS